MSLRPVKQIIQTTPTIEGAGVKLQRAFGFGKTKDFDPFLLLDDFRNENPEDYLAGFPWHPHRGIETITYVLAGSVEHGDSLGNKGKMTAGDVQWMTAGSGILHQEMPKGDSRGRMHGFQLWANLPAALKMTDPRYQDIPAAAIPEVTDDDGTRARIICGEFWGKKRTGRRRCRRSELSRHLGSAESNQAPQISKPRATLSLTSSQAPARFAIRPNLARFSPSEWILPTRRRNMKSAITRSSYSIAAMRSSSKLARKAFASC